MQNTVSLIWLLGWLEMRTLKVGMSYATISTAPGVSFASERFPFADVVWERIFNLHGDEVRGRAMVIDWQRYRTMELSDRLVWIVARYAGEVVAYSGHYWYFDLHFGDKIGADDLWYVKPDFRHRGIGRRVREIGLHELKAMGVTATYDLIRVGGPDLSHMGYRIARNQCMKEL